MKNDFCRTIREMSKWASGLATTTSMISERYEDDISNIPAKDLADHTKAEIAQILPPVPFKSSVPEYSIRPPSHEKENPDDRLFLLLASDELKAKPYGLTKFYIRRLIPDLESGGFITHEELSTPNYRRDAPVINKLRTILFSTPPQIPDEFTARETFMLLDSIVRVAAYEYLTGRGEEKAPDSVSKQLGAIKGAKTKAEKLDVKRQAADQLFNKFKSDGSIERWGFTPKQEQAFRKHLLPYIGGSRSIEDYEATIRRNDWEQLGAN